MHISGFKLLVFGAPALIMLFLAVSLRAGSSAPSNIDWMVSSITSNWKSASVATSTIDNVSVPDGVPNSGWSDVPQVINGGSSSIAIPPYLFVETATPADMAAIPSGKFTMGGGNVFGYFSNSPAREVMLIGFSIEVYEVKYSLWESVRKWGVAHGYTDLPEGRQGKAGNGRKTTPMHPVVEVSWYDCVKWCNARSQKEGLTPVYYLNKSQTNVYKVGKVPLSNDSVDWGANGYRLPTEAEWEKAARGGLENCHFPWGNTQLDGTKANYLSSGDAFDEGTTPVGYFNGRQEIKGQTKRPQDMMNRYGLYDMAGNVYEWCWDYYGELSDKSEESPKGPARGKERIMRGGCWKSRVEFMLYCVKRSSFPPDQHSDFVGFRCVRRL